MLIIPFIIIIYTVSTLRVDQVYQPTNQPTPEPNKFTHNNRTIYLKEYFHKNLLVTFE